MDPPNVRDPIETTHNCSFGILSDHFRFLTFDASSLDISSMIMLANIYPSAAQVNAVGAEIKLGKIDASQIRK